MDRLLTPTEGWAELMGDRLCVPNQWPLMLVGRSSMMSNLGQLLLVKEVSLMKLVRLVILLPVVCAAASIATISVCAIGAAPAGWDQGSCPTGEFDTHFMVLGLGGTVAKPVPINAQPTAGGLGNVVGVG